jgi:hypothetical protein
MDLDELRSLELLSSLREDQLTQLREAGDEVTFQPGEVVFREGEYADSWWLLLGGALELMRRVGRETVAVGWTCPGAGREASAPGTSMASTWPPAEAWWQGGCSASRPRT